MRTNQLLLIGAVAVAGYLLGPQIRTHVLPFLGSFRGFTMRLDPSEMSPVEDRRGEHRAGPGRGGPRGGPGGGVDPWGDARGDASDGSFAGMGGPGGGGGLRCRDTRTGQDVPLSFCERAYGERR
jgi:hypothetical protein